MGVSVLGNFSSYSPSVTILDAVAKIVGSRAATYQINPNGNSQLYDKMTADIDGHRAYNSTGCPGKISDYLPYIRSKSLETYNNTVIATSSNLVSSGGGVYFISNNIKYPIKDAETFDAWGFNWNDVYYTSIAFTNTYSDGPLITRLISAGGSVYWIDSLTKRPIQNADAFVLYGFHWEDVVAPTPDVANLITGDGPIIVKPSLVSDGRGIYYIDGNTKWGIKDPTTFDNWGFSWGNVLTPFDNWGINSYSYSGLLTTLSYNSGGVYLVQNNTFRPIFDSNTFNIFKDNWGVGWNDITPISDTLFASKAQGPLITFPRLVTYSNGGTVYYLDTDGMRPIQSVSTFDHWGFNWNELFYTRNNAFLASYPSPAPLSVLASNNGGVYIISNGTKRPIASAESFNNHATFDPVFRWDNIFPVSDQALSGLTLGDVVY
jgi:hypothetical protein